MTVRDVLKARLERAKGKKQQAKAQVDAAQAEIDAIQAQLAALTPEQEAWLASLCELGVLKTED